MTSETIDGLPGQLPGTIEFTVDGEPGTIAITSDGGTLAPGIFESGQRLEWIARFGRAPESVRVYVLTVRLEDDGVEEFVNGSEIWLTHPMVEAYRGWVGPGGYDGPGRYVLRIVRGRHVLAEGRFEVAPERSEHIH